MAPDTRQAEADRPRLSKRPWSIAALALADAEGLDALTIRRLAAELGVTPMALYWHFRSKEELLAGLGDQSGASSTPTSIRLRRGTLQLRGLLESLVHVLRAHPCASQLSSTARRTAAPLRMRGPETALEVLRRGGFDAEQAARSPATRC